MKFHNFNTAAWKALIVPNWGLPRKPGLVIREWQLLLLSQISMSLHSSAQHLRGEPRDWCAMMQKERGLNRLSKPGFLKDDNVCVCHKCLQFIYSSIQLLSRAQNGATWTHLNKLSKPGFVKEWQLFLLSQMSSISLQFCSALADSPQPDAQWRKINTV